MMVVIVLCAGTILWMAPEIIRGQQYNEMVDVYAYGKHRRRTHLPVPLRLFRSLCCAVLVVCVNRVVSAGDGRLPLALAWLCEIAGGAPACHQQ